jgi:rhodanese-related sulfurtransferase
MYTGFTRMVVRACAILALSSVLALAVNALRPDGLPLVRLAPPSVIAAEAGSPYISLQDAALLHLSGRAVFLDARSVGEYVAGHVKGALSVPLEDYAQLAAGVKAAAGGKETIVTYCDGENCALSEDLADQLRQDGLANVRVLKNGWSLWQNEKLPVASGPNP